MMAAGGFKFQAFYLMSCVKQFSTSRVNYPAAVGGNFEMRPLAPAAALVASRFNSLYRRKIQTRAHHGKIISQHEAPVLNNLQAE